MSGDAVVGDLRILVELFAHAVAYKVSYYGKAVCSYIRFDGSTYIADPVAGERRFEPLEKLCFVTSISFAASSEISPTGKVAAQSP